MQSYNEYRPAQSKKWDSWGAKRIQAQEAIQAPNAVPFDQHADLRFRKATQLIARATGVLRGNAISLDAVANQLNRAAGGDASYYFPSLGQDVRYKNFTDGGVGFHFELELDHNILVKAHVKFHPVNKQDMYNTDVSNLHIRIESIKDRGMTCPYGNDKIANVYFDPANGGVDAARKSKQYAALEKTYGRFGLTSKLNGMMRTLEHLIYQDSSHHKVNEQRDLRGVSAVRVQGLGQAQPAMFAQGNAQPPAVTAKVGSSARVTVANK